MSFSGNYWRKPDYQYLFVCLIPVNDKLRGFVFKKKITTLKNNVCSSSITLILVVRVDYKKRNKKTFNMENVFKKPFLCEICDYTCSLKSILKKHILSDHEGNKPFNCEVCDCRSFRKGDLKKHISSVHEEVVQMWHFLLEILSWTNSSLNND